MGGFFRYLLDRLGAYSFLIGLLGAIGTVVIVGLDAPFYMSAVEVEARVERLEISCVLSWRTVGSGGGSQTMTSDPMTCDKARSVKAGDPMAGYKLQERRRTLLRYGAPTGTLMSEWTGISRFEDRDLAPGDRLTVMIDPESPAVVRLPRDLGNLLWFGGALAVFVAMTVLGWVFQSTAQRPGSAGRRGAAYRRLT